MKSNIIKLVNKWFEYALILVVITDLNSLSSKNLVGKKCTKIGMANKNKNCDKKIILAELVGLNSNSMSFSLGVTNL